MNTLELSRNAAAILEGNPLFARLVLVSAELALLAAVVALSIRLFRIRAPRVRALLWSLVLAKPILGLAIGTPLPLLRFQAPAASGAVSPRPFEEPAAEPMPVAQSIPDVVATDPFTASPPLPRAAAPTIRPGPVAEPGRQPAGMPPPADFLAGLWLVGAVGFAILTIRGQANIRRLRRAAGEPPEALRQRFQDLAQQLPLRRVPGIRITGALSSPALVGLLRPVVLLPPWLIRGADSQQLDWLLRHELMHWKLRDPVALAVRRLAEILFYFHPVVWWVGRKWEEAIELACDRALLRTDEDARTYAEQLYRVLENQPAQHPTSHAAGLFATRTQIGKRIAALLSDPLRSPAHLSRLALLGLALVALISLPVGLGLVHAQSKNPPADAPTRLTATGNPDPSEPNDGVRAKEEANAHTAARTAPGAPPVWGKAVNGLRAALEFSPDEDSYSLGETIGVRFRLQNVSTGTITVVYGQAGLFRPAVEDGTGKPLEVETFFPYGKLRLVRQAIAPGREVVIPNDSLLFKTPSPGITQGSGSHVVCDGPGRYSVHYKLRFMQMSGDAGESPTLLHMSGELGETPDARSGGPQKEDWVGELETGVRDVTIVGAASKTPLVWGKEVDGLRAAFEFVPKRKAYPIGASMKVQFHVQNVSDKAIQIARGTGRTDPGYWIVEDSDGNSVRPGSRMRWTGRNRRTDRRVLKPGETTVLDTEEPLGIAKSPTQRIAGAKCSVIIEAPGRYFFRYHLRLQKSGEGDWAGELETGVRNVTVTGTVADAGRAPAFDQLEVTMRCFGYGPLHREMTIRGDGQAEFALVTRQNETSYSAKFQLSEGQRAALLRALEATEWLELPPEKRMATDAVEYEVVLTRNDRTRRAEFMVQRKPPYQDLEMILANFEKQEYLLYKLTEMTENYRIEAARDIQGELSGRMGRPHRLRSPLAKHINYARYVPVMIPWLKRPEEYRQDEIAAAIDLASYLNLVSARDQIEALWEYRTYSGWDSVCEYLLRLGDRRAASVLKEMALQRKDEACWALIRMGEPAEEAIAEVLRVPPAPNQDPAYKMVRVYLDHWHLLPAPVPPTIAQAMRDACRIRAERGASTEYHDRLLRLLDGGKPVQGLRVSIQPHKPEYGENEPVLVDWKIENVGNEPKKILWHPLDYSPVVFEIMPLVGVAFLNADDQRDIPNKEPEPPEAVTLHPGESRETTVDLRHFYHQAPRLPLGSHVIVGYYRPRDKPANVPVELLDVPKFADAMLDPIGSEFTIIKLSRQPMTREAERENAERRRREAEEAERRERERKERAISENGKPRGAEISRFEGSLEFSKNIPVGLRLGPQGAAGHETFVIRTQWIRFFARDGATRVGMLLHLGPSRVVRINWRIAVEFLGDDDRTLGRAEAVIQTNVMRGTAEAYLPFAGSPWSEVAKATKFRLTIERVPPGVPTTPVGLQLRPAGVSSAGSAPTTQTAAAWGKPAEGVQCSLTADKAIWKSGEFPTFRLAVRNEGVRDFGICPSQQTCEIEWDGRRYGGPPVMAPEFPFEPGCQYNAIPVSLDYKWQDKDTLEPLRVTPGKHTIRVAVFARPNVRAVSNPVEIEILNDSAHKN